MNNDTKTSGVFAENPEALKAQADRAAKWGAENPQEATEPVIDRAKGGKS